MLIFHAPGITCGAVSRDTFEENIEGCTRPRFCLMLNRCQANMGYARRRQIIESADAVIFGNAKALVGNSVEHAVGNKVVDADKARDRFSLFQTFQGKFVAHTLFDVETDHFFLWAVVAGEDPHRASNFLFVKIENALQAMQANGVCRIHHGGDEGDMPVPQFEHMPADKPASVVVIKLYGIDANLLSQVAARQLPILAVIVPFWLSIVMCGFKRSMEILPAILVSGLCFAGAQFVFANFHGPTLPDIMSALATIVGLLVLLRYWQPSNIFRFAEDPAVSTDGPGYPGKVILRAWGPYLILAVMVFFWGLPQFKSVLNSISCPSFSWPLLDGMVNRAAPIVATEAPYAARFTFNWVSAGGSAILLSGFIAVPMMPGYSYAKAVKCFFTPLHQLRFPILTIGSVLGLAFLMNYAGMSSTLGLAFTKTGGLFPFFAPLIGWLGVFLTGSDTSSNALFSSMQRTTATAVGIPPELAVASNAVGGVTGKMISPPVHQRGYLCYQHGRSGR